MEAYYGKEPFDLRLTILRILRQWKAILIWTVIGTCALTACYCLKNIVLSGEKQYRSVSTYRADYGVEDTEVGLVVINATTWDTYVHTEEFYEMVCKYLPDSLHETVTKEMLQNALKGNLESDWRVPETTVTTTDAEVTTAITSAVEQAMVLEFPKGISELKSVRVLDTNGPKEVIPDVRVGRAIILSLVVSLFAVLVVLLIKETGDDNIWLPGTITTRYGIKTLGVFEDTHFVENVKYMFKDCKRVAVCSSQDEHNPKELTDRLFEINETTEDLRVNWIALPSPVLCPEVVRPIRETDGVLVVVEAGEHAGKQLERMLEYLNKQDCKVLAAVLCDADETLISWYYGFPKMKKERSEKDES